MNNSVSYNIAIDLIGYFTTYLQESQEGPPRKYYKLTDLGFEVKDELKREWVNFSTSVNNIIMGGGFDHD